MKLPTLPHLPTLDQADRRVVSGALIVAGAAVFVLLLVAGALGLAVRVFLLMAGW